MGAGSELRSPHEVLGVDAAASPAELHAAYRRKAWALHPDRVPPGDETGRARAEEAMRELNQAWREVRRPPGAGAGPPAGSFEWEDFVWSEVWPAPPTAASPPTGQRRRRGGSRRSGRRTLAAVVAAVVVVIGLGTATGLLRPAPTRPPAGSVPAATPSTTVADGATATGSGLAPGDRSSTPNPSPASPGPGGAAAVPDDPGNPAGPGVVTPPDGPTTPTVDPPVVTGPDAPVADPPAGPVAGDAAAGAGTLAGALTSTTLLASAVDAVCEALKTTTPAELARLSWTKNPAFTVQDYETAILADARQGCPERL